MPQRLPLPARLAIAGVKLAAVGTIAALGVFGTGPVVSTGSTTGYAGQHAYVAPPVATQPDRVGRLLEAHTCSTTGFDTEQQPLSAVVRSASGALRYVDFDTGWRVYTARGDATLVAVCLDDPPA